MHLKACIAGTEAACWPLADCAEEQLDAAYQEIKDVKTVGRGLGFWGDMVITLRNGDKIELRSLPQCAALACACGPSQWCPSSAGGSESCEAVLYTSTMCNACCRFRELRDYILKRREELSGDSAVPGRGKDAAKGFA